MFFKGKKPAESPEPAEQIEELFAPEADEEAPAAQEASDQPDTDGGEAYAFYKPDPYPKELVSVLKSMLQRLFPDTRRAYLLEAQKSDRKGYLLIVDIDSKFLKIINIYLDGETKRVRGNIPIECILYSKSGSLTEGIDPFYAKETSQSKANNLASKEFSGDVVFSKMPEFELWADDRERRVKQTDENTDPSGKINVPDPVVIPVKKEANHPKSDAGVKPSTKKELFGILNEYGSQKSAEVSAVAMAAIREYEFYIPYTSGGDRDFEDIDTTLPIDETLRFKKLLAEDGSVSAVPLFTEKDDALAFAAKDSCRMVLAKYKDFASSAAAELTGFDGVIINPGSEELFLPSDHPLLKEE